MRKAEPEKRDQETRVQKAVNSKNWGVIQMNPSKSREQEKC